ncbi:hypothetical protein vseg_005014 [Gypsophila vaccaria]
MGLLRALSTTKGRRGGYDRLVDETKGDATTARDCKGGEPVLKRVATVPARKLFGSSSRKINTTSTSNSSSSSSTWYETSYTAIAKSNNDSGNKQQDEKVNNKGGKVHPVFGLFDGRSWSKRKFTSNPDFSRYAEYLKQGGVVKSASEHSR